QDGTSTAAGRRVILPIGRSNKFNWDYLNNNGRLLVQRALEWGANADVLSAGDLLLVVGNNNSLSSSEASKKALFESWNYAVTSIDDDDSQSNYDSAFVGTEVIYVFESVSDARLADKLTNTNVGIVSESENTLDEFGIASATPNNVNSDQFSNSNAGHYITAPFSGNNIVHFTTNLTMFVVTGILALDLKSVTSYGSAPPIIAVPSLDSGARRWDNTLSSGRRVFLPYGNANAIQLTTDGETLLRRSLEWASGKDLPGPIAHWKLNENTGTTALDSEGGHDGVLANGASWDFGANKGGVKFSAWQDRIVVPHDQTLSINNKLTLMSWVYIDELQPSRVIVHKGIDSLTHTYYLGLYNSAIQFALSPDGGGWNNVVSGDTDIQINKWHHVAVTFDDSSDEVKFYLDGSNISTGLTAITPQINTGDIHIGGNYDGYNFPGRLDDVRIYNRVLAAEEIVDLAKRSAKMIYWTDDNAEKIQRSDQEGNNVEVIVDNQPQVRGLDIDTTNRKIYWTSNVDIRRANLDGSNIEIVYSGALVNLDIKLDVASGKMYWTHDNNIDQIMRANLDGSNVETINSSLDAPAYLTLNIEAGYLYVTEFGSGNVSRMNTDGTLQTTLISGSGTPVGNALNLTDEKMYWSSGSSGGWIKRSNLDGSNEETIISGLYTPQDITYDSINDRIYWTDALTNPSIKRANADGSNVQTIVDTGLDRPRGILVVDADLVVSAGSGGVEVCNGTYLDRFDNALMDGSNGSLDWSTSAWVEVGESDGLEIGDVQIRNDLGDNRLRIRDNNNGGEGVERIADLTGAATATLSFDYRRVALDSSGDFVAVTVSDDGGSSWILLSNIGTTNDSSYQSFSIDISSYISADTMVRLRSSTSMGNKDIVYFDNFQIECSQ
ncbi:MAG: DUF5050 domain-containing protein, partial [Kangiellaceae bacterium]|nr:DUF5050 domain-containing protein [Kangiellaceae bacterium]